MGKRERCFLFFWLKKSLFSNFRHSSINILHIFHHFLYKGLTFYAFTLCGRPLIMTCMCQDCYVAVFHTITYHQKNSTTARIMMICFVWFCLFAFSFIVFFFAKDFGLIALGPFTPTIIIVSICHSFILHALLERDSSKRNIHLQKRRAVQTLINSLVMMMFVYIPPIIMVIIGKTAMSIDVFFCTIKLPGYSLPSFGSAVMPILHLVNRKKASLSQVCVLSAWQLMFRREKVASRLVATSRKCFFAFFSSYSLGRDPESLS